MYYYLHGLVTMHTADAIVVECHGVGYDCFVSHPDEYPIGEIMFVFVSYYAYDNEQFLIGFRTMEEKNLYQELTTVKGIGPKTALTALSSTTVERLSQAITTANEAFLMTIPGIGKKNASQMILDLRGKLTLPSLGNQTGEKNLDLALDGLRGLGFRDSEIQNAFAQIPERQLTVEEYMTKALRLLNRR